MHLADLSNSNLKPWVIDALKKAHPQFEYHIPVADQPDF